MAALSDETLYEAYRVLRELKERTESPTYEPTEAELRVLARGESDSLVPFLRELAGTPS